MGFPGRQDSCTTPKASPSMPKIPGTLGATTSGTPGIPSRPGTPGCGSCLQSVLFFVVVRIQWKFETCKNKKKHRFFFVWRFLNFKISPNKPIQQRHLKEMLSWEGPGSWGWSRPNKNIKDWFFCLWASIASLTPRSFHLCLKGRLGVWGKQKWKKHWINRNLCGSVAHMNMQECYLYSCNSAATNGAHAKSTRHKHVPCPWTSRSQRANVSAPVITPSLEVVSRWLLVLVLKGYVWIYLCIIYIINYVYINIYILI